jgi:signal peptidase I
MVQSARLGAAPAGRVTYRDPMSRPGRPGPAGDPQDEPWPADDAPPGWFEAPAQRPVFPLTPVYPPPPEPAAPEPPDEPYPWPAPRLNGTYPAHRPPATPFPLDDDSPTEILRRYVPAHELLDREARGPRASRQEQLRAAGVLPPHPPRAVVRRRRARRRKLEWPFLVVFALLAAFGIRAFVVQTFYIPSASMHETLLEGDRVLVNKLSYRLHPVHRGDIVVFRRPPNFPVEDDDLIKRVVGLPGETVEAHGGLVYVDHRRLGEPYVDAACHGTEDFAPVRVPAAHVWVMGDNRCDSSDSRVFGPIAEKLLVGRAFVLVWPVGRVAWL